MTTNSIKLATNSGSIQSNSTPNSDKQSIEFDAEFITSLTKLATAYGYVGPTALSDLFEQSIRLSFEPYSETELPASTINPINEKWNAIERAVKGGAKEYVRMHERAMQRQQEKRAEAMQAGRDDAAKALCEAGLIDKKARSQVREITGARWLGRTPRRPDAPTGSMSNNITVST